ncbi:MAG: hypothetical protein KC458_02245 [Dehalococcoidia bacterium]|nr:hypothetical protein [Dehalococcoidia bacterium]
MTRIPRSIALDVLAATALLATALLAACGSSGDGGGGDAGANVEVTATASPTPSGTIPPSETAMTAAAPLWAWNGQQWTNLGGPAPECPDVLVPAVDVGAATSVLYPGQVRSDYKAHGGFRFDGLGAYDVPVVSPIDGVLMRGARYLASGEVQFTLDIVHPCGLMVRLGHLRELTPKWDAYFANFPAPVELDSRATFFDPAPAVVAGEPVAVAVGVVGTSNTFIDIGVYDLRHRNAASEDPAWLAEHDNDTHAYGLCWFGMFGPELEQRVAALPAADGQMGTTSDYCAPR